jgi:putative solute:sodium symporter small subunit
LRGRRSRLYSARFGSIDGSPGHWGTAASEGADKSARNGTLPGGFQKRTTPFPDRREPAMQLSEKHREYWSKNLGITAVLLAIWFIVTFVVGYFARDLSFNFFGWPFAFWVGAQGALVVYVIIIWYYARYMNNLDIEYGVDEKEEA